MYTVIWVIGTVAYLRLAHTLEDAFIIGRCASRWYNTYVWIDKSGTRIATIA